MRSCLYCLAFLSCFFAFPAWSDNACLNSAESTNYDIINEIQKSQDPLIAAFNAQVKPAESSLSPEVSSSEEAEVPSPQTQKQVEKSPWWCITCFFRTHCIFEESNSFKDLKAVSEYFSKDHKLPSASSKIKKDCLISSLKRDVGGDEPGYTCKNGKASSFSNTGSDKACINQKAVDYMQFAIHAATECLSTPESPLDPRMVLRMINNESGSNFYVGAKGGVGLAQLTSDPVEDMAGWYETEYINPKTKKVVYSAKEDSIGYFRSRYYSLQGLKKENHVFIKGRGSYVLQSIADSPNPACAPFKKMAEEDLQKPPASPGRPANYCSWVSPGNGLAHNLIYALGYMKYTRDMVIKPYLEKHSSTLANNQEVLDSLALVAYGHGGASAAKSLINSLRINKNSDPATVERELMQDNDYLRNTQKKMRELLANLKPSPFSAADLQGDSCIVP